MTAIEDLERRVGALEARVRAGELDTAAINEKLNGVIGGQDVIMGILRDHGTQLADHHARFDRIDARFEQVDARFDRIDARFEQVDARFEQVGARFEQVDARFDRIEGKLDLVVTWIQSRP